VLVEGPSVVKTVQSPCSGANRKKKIKSITFVKSDIVGLTNIFIYLILFMTVNYDKLKLNLKKKKDR